nr:uncharacterized protein LOC123573581 [Macaca fascicularis]
MRTPWGTAKSALSPRVAALRAALHSGAQVLEPQEKTLPSGQRNWENETLLSKDCEENPHYPSLFSSEGGPSHAELHSSTEHQESLSLQPESVGLTLDRRELILCRSRHKSSAQFQSTRLWL